MILGSLVDDTTYIFFTDSMCKLTEGHVYTVRYVKVVKFPGSEGKDDTGVLIARIGNMILRSDESYFRVLMVDYYLIIPWYVNPWLIFTTNSA